MADGSMPVPEKGELAMTSKRLWHFLPTEEPKDPRK